MLLQRNLYGFANVIIPYVKNVLSYSFKNTLKTFSKTLFQCECVWCFNVIITFAKTFYSNVLNTF